MSNRNLSQEGKFPVIAGKPNVLNYIAIALPKEGYLKLLSIS